MPKNDAYTQSNYAIRCEWGLRGVEKLAPECDVIVIIDTLSFSTCIDVAVSRGALVLPYRFKDHTVTEFAISQNAIAAGLRKAGGYSLSPASFINVEPGTRVVLPSPNGATLSLATKGKPTLAGCLRNAQSIARAAMRLGKRIGVIPAGERWHDGTLRPAIEDLLGAGAIISELDGSHSPEALAALATFEHFQDRLPATLFECVSGLELVDRGYPNDVESASQHNISDAVPMLRDGAYVNVKDEIHSG
jgi:2-phosphosulfolactate phosphatase